MPRARGAGATDQLSQTDPVDYSVVDLGSGREWLTSRLFILAIVLARMRGVKAFVFVATRGGVERTFLGVAAPDDVRWALAQRYSWLEPAFARAYGSIGVFAVVSATGMISMPDDAQDVNPAIQLVQSFVGNIQERKPGAEPAEWVSLSSPVPGQATVEHAQWLTAEGLRAILGDRLDRSALTVGDRWPASPERLAPEVIERTGDYVARVDETGRFDRLLDRRSVVERAARQWARAAGAQA